MSNVTLILTKVIKKSNPHFKYEQFLRLRNMIFLCLMLKRNESLRKLRYHYLLRQAKEKRSPDKQVDKFQLPFLGKGLKKIIDKAKMTFGGSGVSLNNREHADKYRLRDIQDDPYFHSPATVHTDDNGSDEGAEEGARYVQFERPAVQRRVRTRSM